MPADGNVLCVRRDEADRLCGAGPWVNGSEAILQSLFDRPDSWAWLPRDETEDSPNWRQVIPVLVLRELETRRVLAYRRQDSGGDDRLAGQWSLALGGHCSWAKDAANAHIGPRSALFNGLRRELAEEVATPTGLTPGRLDARPVGMIRSDASPVDAAHLGWVWQGWLPAWTEVVPAADEITEALWITPDDLECQVAAGSIDLESWGRILLADLLGA